jgi:hypothetical protein
VRARVSRASPAARSAARAAASASRSAVSARASASAFAGDVLGPAVARLAGAAQLVGGGAAGQHGEAGGLEPEAAGLDLGPGGGEVVERRGFGLGFGERLPGAGAFLGAAAGGGDQTFLPGEELFQRCFGAGERAGGVGGGLVGGAAGGARGSLGGLCPGKRLGGGGVVRAGRGGGPGGFSEAGGEAAQTVPVLKTQGRGRGRVAGGDPQPVPAPEVALGADEALAGPELGLESVARGRVDEPGRREAAGERGRRLDMRGERAGARGQVALIRRRRKGAPAGARRVARFGRGDVLAQRGAEGAFEAGSDGDEVEHAAAGDGIAGEQPFQAGHLGCERLFGALGLRPPGAGGGFGGLSRSAGGLGLGQCGFRGDRPGGSLLGEIGRGGAGGFGARAFGCEAVAGGFGLGQRPVGSGGAAAGLGGLGLYGLVPGAEPGDLLGKAVVVGLGGGECVARLLRQRLGVGQGFGMVFPGGVQRRGFFGEAGEGFGGVAVERSLAVGVAAELGAGGVEFGDPPGGLGGLGIEAVAFDEGALEDRRRATGGRATAPRPGADPRRSRGSAPRPSPAARARPSAPRAPRARRRPARDWPRWRAASAPPRAGAGRGRRCPRPPRGRAAAPAAAR